MGVTSELRSPRETALSKCERSRRGFYLRRARCIGLRLEAGSQSGLHSARTGLPTLSERS